MFLSFLFAISDLQSSFVPIPITVLERKMSPVPCVTLSFHLLCDPCCWEGGGQLLSFHFPELSWWTVGLLPFTDFLWREEKLWAWQCICVRVWMTWIPTVWVSEYGHWVVNSVKTWYSNTCWVCVQRNALLLLGVMKRQQLAVGLLTLLTVNHNHKDKIQPH